MVSQRLSSVTDSVIRDTTARSIARGAINLGQGLSRTPPPPALLDALAHRAAGANQSYGPARGEPALRREISRKFLTYNGIEYDAEHEVVVTIGATGAYSAALLALLDPGSEVLLIEPFYSYHRDLARAHGLRVATVPLDPFTDRLTEGLLRAAVSRDTRAVVVCTPSNPSGHRLTRAELEAVAAVAEQYDLLILSDEIYEYIYFDAAPHLSPAALAPQVRARTVTISGLSKTYGVPGWRLGYAAAPAPLAAGLGKAADLLTVCAPTPLQEVAVAALRLPAGYYESMRADLRRRKDVVAAAFTALGLRPNSPDGAYYLLVDCTEMDVATGWDAAEVLLSDYGLATIPGDAFHDRAPLRPYVRACFGIDDSDVRALTAFAEEVPCSPSYSASSPSR